MKIVIYIFIVVFSFDVCAEKIDSNVGFGYEKQALSALEVCDISNVYFVRIFGGYAPIPNSYKILNKKSIDEYIRMDRMPMKKVKYHSDGYILVGKFSNNLPDRVAKKDNSPRSGFIDNGEYKKYREFNIYFRKAVLGNLKQVVIYKDGEYMEFFDEDDTFWKMVIDYVVYANKCIQSGID